MNNLSKILAAAATALTGAAGKAEAQEPPPAQQVRQAPEHMRIPRGIDAQPPQERIELPEAMQRPPFGEADVPEIPIGEPREREYLGIDDLPLSRSMPVPDNLGVNVDVGVVETPSGAAEDDAVAGLRIERRN